MSDIDLEKPYIEAGERQDKLEAEEDSVRTNFLYELANDEKAAEEFVTEWVNESPDLLSQLLQVIARNLQLYSVRLPQDLEEKFYEIIEPYVEWKARQNLNN